jgi:hypothetical protein
MVLSIAEDDSEAVETTLSPHINSFSVASTTGALLHIKVTAVTAAGSVTSGDNSFLIASVPPKPSKLLNDASVTDSTKIQVRIDWQSLQNGGSPITNV